MEEAPHARALESAPPGFAADRMLKRLARWLRLMGADVYCDDSRSAAEVLRIARDEKRVMLTRDKRLRTAPDVVYVESQLFRDQLREVLARHPFDPRRCAFSRCSLCNEELRTIARERVARRVPPFVFAAHETFSLCPRCNHIYWDATHRERAMREIEELLPSTGFGHDTSGGKLNL